MEHLQSANVIIGTVKGDLHDIGKNLVPMMKETIDAFTKAGFREKVKIMIGGAPVTKSFADEINADGFAPDAGSAAKLAKALAT